MGAAGTVFSYREKESSAKTKRGVNTRKDNSPPGGKGRGKKTARPPGSLTLA